MNQHVASPSRDAARPKSKFRPPAVHQVRVGGFFGPRIDTVASTTAHTLLDRCIEAGMLDQVDPDRPNPGIRIPFQVGNDTVTTQMFWDSDFGKSIETAAYALFRKPDPELEARVDEVIDAFGRLQDADGYLNSWYQRIEPGKRWSNLRDCHELYDAGHLIEGAVAYYHATGKRKLMDIMARYADHIADQFGPAEGQSQGYCGHPEIELALVRLGRATGEQRYLDLAKFFVDERGQQPPHFFDEEAKARGRDPSDYHFGTYEYSQSHKPVREQRKVVGHAVRAAYLYSGMADVATEFGDETLRPALDALFSHLTDKNLYVTGGFGPSAHNEGLTFDYDLPNETAYAETCAAVALGFWTHRMAQTDLDAKFTDRLETVLYNGALSGIARDGEHYFYENVLESHGQHRRWKWHYCPCCPTNIARLLTSLGTYFYSAKTDELAVHLYGESTGEFDLDGRFLRLRQTTRYPWDGDVSLRLTLEAPAAFTLRLRIPGWCREAEIRVNGERIDLGSAVTKGYAAIRRGWENGDEIRLSFAMPIERLHAHPAVGEDAGRIALRRGPVVYCVEEADLGTEPQRLRLPAEGALEARFDPELLGGAVVLEGEALEAEEWSGDLYRTERPALRRRAFRAIPYHLWANRAPGAMQVWLLES